MQDHAVRPNQTRVFDFATLQVDQVADYASRTNDSRQFGCRMDNGPVLDRGARPDDHSPEVPAEDGAGPYRGLGSQSNVADDCRVGMDECVGVDDWHTVSQCINRHPTILGVGSGGLPTL